MKGRDMLRFFSIDYGSIVVVLILCGLCGVIICESTDPVNIYMDTRKKFVDAGNSLSINSAWTLTPEETAADVVLSRFKTTDSELNPIPVQLNFVTMHETIKESELYAALRKMPKGALLHHHDTSGIDMHFFVKQSYLSGCLYDVNTGAITFLPSEGYVPISTVRNSWPGGPSVFDEALYLNFTILGSEDQLDTTGDALWGYFQPIFGRLHDFFAYKPVMLSYYRELFERIFEDGISRVELRTSLVGVYDEAGNILSDNEVMQMLIDELNVWKAQDPVNRAVFSFGIIVQSVRAGSVEEVSQDLKGAYKLRDLFPDYVVGFDLVGHEDEGQSLLYWAPVLINVQEEIMNAQNISYPALPYFFHAGESNRISVQENILDALLLRTTRMGHGFGVQQFPIVWPELRASKVLIESCPISNQMLGLVVDQRNHPIGQLLHHAYFAEAVGEENTAVASSLLSELITHDSRIGDLLQAKRSLGPSFAVSINNDDPGFWGINAEVSFDWYVSVLAWDLSIAGIKQLCIDSIVHSGGSVQTRADLLLHWYSEWKDWVRDVAAL